MSFYVFYMLIGNLFVGPFSNMFDPFYLYKLFKQSYARKKLEKGTLRHYTQKDLNQLYEPPEMNLHLRYCNIIRTFLVSVFFFEILPIGMVICLLFLIVQFWVDKLMVLRRYKRLPRYHPKLAHELSEIAEVAIFLLAAGSCIFKWRAGHQLHTIDICSLAVGCLFLVIPLKAFARTTVNSEKVLDEYNESNLDHIDDHKHLAYVFIDID